ncbi:MAG: ribonuclease P protein component [Candidatus Stygibacter australis]|nr:ribonuclease P protein component [Candidatus Stygibacter australis]MDP8323406.1 ribonuclease P protein component [Candidatus Stygibacter australis]
MRFIRSTREYHEVYAKHERRHGTLFLFLRRKTEDSEERAVGIVVSRKVGKAVWRNKVKRRVRAYLREHPEQLPLGKLVIIAKESSGTSDWAGISKDLGRNLQAFEE